MKTALQCLAPVRLLSFSGLLLFLLNTGLPVLAAEDPLASDLKKMQGKWKATVTNERGTSVWKLEIKDNKSVLVIESEDGDPLFKAQNEFKLEKFGRFRAYTYFNLKILSGSSEGETRYTGGETKSSVYKLDGDTLTTVGGLREDDEEKPLFIKWTRQ